MFIDLYKLVFLNPRMFIQGGKVEPPPPPHFFPQDVPYLTIF